MAAAEGVKIKDMIDNESVVPEGPNQMYHIVGIKWYNDWLKYTGQAASGENGPHPGPMNSTKEFADILDAETMNN